MVDIDDLADKFVLEFVGTSDMGPGMMSENTLRLIIADAFKKAYKQGYDDGYNEWSSAI